MKIHAPDSVKLTGFQMRWLMVVSAAVVLLLVTLGVLVFRRRDLA